MKDISEEIKCYQQDEMSSFQRINLVLSDLGNQQLQKYLKDQDAIEITKEDDPKLDSFFKNIKIDLSSLDLSAQLLVTHQIVQILKYCNFTRLHTEEDLKTSDWKSISDIFANLVKTCLMRHYSPETLAYKAGVGLSAELTDEQQILINFLC